ncbi:two-component system chemotaxis response regulator CheB [Natranaerovirga hydrolytica]|uniref:Protein-glutamate methylesterase/protein-glutamine glutaminase n=1 Tax=Natranaerovirga hydrolytica TaxID=680378 RepID=A0A4R1N5M4_9FIRM|nr:chemotaxis response regulator protein-glutamate methylesterase [Natranaerovirga hydrolytica]TCK97913.1 two-component system chemotaxis response regulator CheB [Natranaerovirga hydrolytica]
MRHKKKIVIIDDSAFMRRVFSDIIKSDQRFDVVATANNGLKGLEIIEEYKPDAIILDINMPIMDGLDVLEALQKKPFIPTIVASSIAEKGGYETIKALELGAFDFIRKPENIFHVKNTDFITIFIEKLLLALECNNCPRIIMTSEIKKTKTMNPNNTRDNKIIAIGCSTGGPKALHDIIPYLPKNLNSSIVIVQHMPKGFTKSLANRLNDLSALTVKEAEHGEILESGTVYIAKGGHHMFIRKKNDKHIIELNQEPLRMSHRPSVNNMLDSLIHTSYDEIIGVILTGMGNDGTEGMFNLKENKNTYVIAQNEATCVVYGMPKSIVTNKLADTILPIQDITKTLMTKVGVL